MEKEKQGEGEGEGEGEGQREREAEEEAEKEEGRAGRLGNIVWAHSLFPFGPFAMDFLRRHLKEGGSVAYLDLECNTDTDLLKMKGGETHE